MRREKGRREREGRGRESELVSVYQSLLVHLCVVLLFYLLKYSRVSLPVSVSVSLSLSLPVTLDAYLVVVIAVPYEW